MTKQFLKKLASITLSLALVFTMMPSMALTARAATTDEIHITDLDMTRIVGQKPDTTVGYGSDIQSVVVTWEDDNTGEVISGNFEVGMSPRLKIDVVVKNSNSFADRVALYINGVGAYAYSAKDDNKFSYSIPFSTLRAQVPETIEITGLDLDVSANEVLDTAVSVNTDAVTCEVQWTDKVNGDKLTKAEYYTSPKLRFVVRPVEGYDFVSSPKLKVNGTLVEASKISDSEGELLVYIKEFSQIVPPADKVIKEVGISGSDYGRENLVIGKAPVLDYTCLNDRVNFACWYEDDITGNKITKFAAGQKARLKFEMTPKDGYVFPYDEKVTVYVNGYYVSVHGNSTFKKVVASIPYGVLEYDDIQSLNINDYTKPSPNHAPDKEFGLSDTNVASAIFAWTDSNGNSVTKFEAGKTYTCTATFVGKSGHGFSSVANIQLMYKGVPYLTFDKNQFEFSGYNNKLVATVTYTIPADAAEEHTWDAGTITTKPTCKAEGVKTYKCAGCGTTKTEPVAKLTTHSYDSGKVTKSATCTATGTKIYTCTVCSATKTETIAKLGHKYSTTYTVDKKATTSADGSKSKHCTRCDAKSSVTAIPKVSTVKLSTSTYTYSGGVKSPSVTVKDSKGNKLVKDTDYTLSTPSGRKNAGTYTYKVTFKGKYSGTKSLKLTIKPKKIDKLTLSKTTYVYDGNAKKPTVTVKAGSLSAASKVTKSNSNVTITYASGRTKVGTYKVTVKGKGNYTGSLTKTFKINPKATKITSLTKGKKSFTVKWSKKTTQTTGYQIYYTTSKTRTNGKQITISKNTTTKKTISKLKSGKKYYVWVRTYKTVDGKKYYSTWSDRKYVTTK